MKATNNTQAEYLNKITRLLKVKNLIDQVKDSLLQVETYEQKRKEFSKIFSQICNLF